MLHTKKSVEIGPPVMEKIFEWYLPYERPSWSCDQDITNKISMPLPKEAPHKKTGDYMACIRLYFSSPEHSYEAPDADLLC